MYFLMACLRGDVPGAYLTAALTGPRTFVRVPVHLRQMTWRKWESVVDPVLEARAGIYGLPRGDTG